MNGIIIQTGLQGSRNGSNGSTVNLGKQVFKGILSCVEVLELERLVADLDLGVLLPIPNEGR